MAIRYVVLDFDGTFTEVEKEGEPFTSAYQEYLADLLGKDENLVRDTWKTAEKRVQREPERFGGFEENGKVVAPPCDPYLRASATARIVLHRFQVLRHPVLRNEVLQSVYRLAYKKSATCFRDEAAAVLDALLARQDLQVAVVTNAAPDAVLEKLAKLKLVHRSEHRPAVVGNAYKFGLASAAPEPMGLLPPEQADRLAEWQRRFEEVPSELSFSQLGRPIYARRGSYFRVLRDHVWKGDLAGPRDTLVVGDVYELDLALPAALGAHVHLVTREHTPPHEIEIVKKLEKGGVSGGLREVLDRLA